jgi:MSHA pilin protein MshD
MSMTSPRQRGFTLIELIIFIVVVAAGLAGILSVMNTVVKSSADPMIRKQTIAIAESLLEEILLKDYCDPDMVEIGTADIPIRPPVCYCNPNLSLIPNALIPTSRCQRSPQDRLGADKEASRKIYDDVEDYNGYATTGGIVDAFSTTTPLPLVVGLENYNISSVSVAVATAAESAELNAISAKRVTVTVTGPQGSVSLIGYRSNY